MIYRRRKNDSVWHFCTNCRHWPMIGGFIEYVGKPERGKFCKDCHDKYANGECPIQKLPRVVPDRQR